MPPMNPGSFKGGFASSFKNSFKQLTGSNRKTVPEPAQFTWQRPGQVTDGPFRTHYQLTGPANGRLVVCIHGMGTYSSPIFEDLVPLLERAGFLVLQYDLLGMGFSHSSPNGTYTDKMFVSQLESLIEHLNLSESPFDIIAHSSGAALAVKYAHRHPRVQSLVLLSPTGLCGKPNSIGCFGRNQEVYGVIGVTEKNWRSGFESHQGAVALREQELVDHQKLMYENNPAAKEAVALFAQQFPQHDLEHELISVTNRTNRKVLIGWGKYDKVVPMHPNLDRWKKILNDSPSKVEYEIVDGGHFFHLEQRHLSLIRITNFLVGYAAVVNKELSTVPPVDESPRNDSQALSQASTIGGGPKKAFLEF